MDRKLIYSLFLVVVLSMILTGTTKAELVGWWRLDEGSGTIAYDASGNGNDGTFNGAPQWVAGRFGGALEFDGSDDYVTIGNLNLPGSFTLAFWMLPPSLPGGWHSVVMKEYDYGFEFDGTNLLGRSGNGTGGWGATVSTTISTPAIWYHAALTWNGSDLEMFIDGTSVSKNSGTHISNTTPLLFASWNTSSEFFAGIIDDVRIYNHAMSESEILAAMEGGKGYPYALGPNPKDGAVIEDTWVNLSWSPGDFAVSHDVYLGDNFDDVNNGTGDTFRGNQTGTFIIAGFPGFPYPDGLVPGTTYYWRIDEINDAEPNSPWKGEIWSFSIPPKTAYNPNPADGAEFVQPGTELSWTPGFGAKLHTVYIGTDFDTVDSAAGGALQGIAKYKSTVPFESEKVYYWRVDEFDAIATYKGDVWGFTTPGAAGSLSPANGAVDVQINSKLAWIPAAAASSHDVYFGADKEAVRNATTASAEFKGNKAKGSESYDPGKLEWNSDNYWRIDAVYSTGTVKGLVWNFTTADFLLVDDFESYNDIDPPDPASNRIFDKWIDGFGTTNNGALVGNNLPPYAEQTTVHGGSQSMPYFYDNNLKTSEATLTLVSPRDWTAEGVTKLSLWFRGGAGNSAEKMFVVLNGNVVYHDEPAVTQKIGWNEWVIDLQSFADQGVNLTNVNTITIGIGTKGSPAAGGTGTMYFDDIRLYR